MPELRDPQVPPWENLLISDAAEAAGSRAVEGKELLGALRKDVGVLEKTKGQFKSKELGDLSKQIEAILPDSGFARLRGKPAGTGLPGTTPGSITSFWPVSWQFR